MKILSIEEMNEKGINYFKVKFLLPYGKGDIVKLTNDVNLLNDNGLSRKWVGQIVQIKGAILNDVKGLLIKYIIASSASNTERDIVDGRDISFLQIIVGIRANILLVINLME